MESRVVSIMKTARFSIGQVVRHRLFPFRGIIFDVDPQFANTEEWYQSIPAEVRPSKDQPFYHLLAENSETEYIAYVSEQNLLEDDSGDPVRHPQIKDMFDKKPDGRYEPKGQSRHLGLGLKAKRLRISGAFFVLDQQAKRLKRLTLPSFAAERAVRARAIVSASPGSARP